MKKQNELELFGAAQQNGAPKINPLALLSQDPETVVPMNKGRQTFDSIPISYLQADLDRFFGPGNWWVENQVITPFGALDPGKAAFNVQVDLVVNWQNFGGTVARYVGTYGGYITNGNVATATAMAQGMAFKNAASKIGKRFGRDLNRAMEENYTSKHQLDTLSPAEKIAAAETVPELLSIFKQFNRAAQAELKPALAARKAEIQAATKADPNF